MKKFLAASLLLLISIQLFATHIAGGNIELQYVAPNQYQIVLKLYRSCESGSSSMPSSVQVGIYRLDTDVLLSSYTLTSPIITANLPFGDSCYTPTGLCVDRGIFTSGIINIADHAAGYYLHGQIFARNGSISNLNAPGSTAMSFYTEIPDPAIGINNTPQFGPYPADAYFCVGTTKYFDFSVTDIDGDSLSYELVNPLAGTSAAPTTNGTFPKPYPSVNWAGGFSLANICGGTPPMSVDPTTGIINASPALTGKYVFALKVHEWRGGVKIGETTLDIQYESLPCTLDTPPEFTALGDTITVNVSTLVCFDIMAQDMDGSDTIFVQAFSSEFDLYTNYVGPTSAISPSGSWYYLNYLGLDTLWMDHYVNVDTFTFEGIGIIPLRYCWTPPCIDVDSTFGLDLITFSLGCSGSDTTNQHVEVLVTSPAPPVYLNIPDTVNVILGDSICFEILAQDPLHPADTLFLEILGANFDLSQMYIPPALDTTSGLFYYEDFLGVDTLWITDFTNVADSIYYATEQTPLRYCFTPECEDIDSLFNLTFMAYSTVCNSDSSIKDLFINVVHVPTPIVFNVPDSIQVNVNDSICFDILVFDTVHVLDTISLEIYNADFDLAGTYVPPVFDAISGLNYYLDFMGSDTLWIGSFQEHSDSLYSAQVNVPLRYCWDPGCEAVDSIFTLSFMAYSTLCNSDTVYSNLVIEVIHVPTPILFNVPDSIEVNVGDSICFDIIVFDTIQIFDTLSLEIYNADFDLAGTYVPPVFDATSGLNYYLDFMGSDTLWIESFQEHSDSLYSAQVNVPLRYCWHPGCEDVDSTFNLSFMAYSTICNSDTAYKDLVIEVVHIPTPIILDIPSAIAVSIGDSICFDVMAYDTINVDETLSLNITQADFDLSDMYVPPIYDASSGQDYYLDFLGFDTLWLASYLEHSDSLYSAVIYTPLRYCWTPGCETVDSSFNISFMSYSTACKSDTVYQDLSIDVIYSPPVITLTVPSSMIVELGDYTCMDIFTNETDHDNDTLSIVTITSNFNLSSSLVVPSIGIHNSELMHYYTNFYSSDTMWMQDYFNIGNTTTTQDSIGLRYCWTTNCDDVFQEDYIISFMAISKICTADTAFATTSFHVDPPLGGLNPIPNVFTPNNDGDNDFFKLEGLSDPCYDTMNIVIYNRWGRIVFESNDPEFSWDGTNKRGAKCSEGAFFVLIKGSYGSTYDPTTGLRIPNAIEEEYHVSLFR
ncbi:MAG: gliding motility-associated C-terminal domain-containing protein [Flavobacteriales bacterium]|nr:gliding motility-associated C-terminal domain-containing protein [Flavobacteriales bacterium]